MSFEKEYKLINRISELLKRGLNSISKSLGCFQPTDIYSSGLHKRPSGIIIFRKNFEHQFLFEWYEVVVLNVFILFFGRITKERKTVSAQFALRTLEEIAFKKAQILFNPNLPSVKKSRYKLIMYLSELAMLLSQDKKYVNNFEKLLRENTDILSNKWQEVLSATLNFAKKDKKIPVDLFEQIDRLIATYEGELFDDKRLPDIVTRGNLYSAHRHILSKFIHGRPLVIQHFFENYTQDSLEARVVWTQLLSGVTLFGYISEYEVDIYDKAIIDEIEERLEKVAPILRKKGINESN